MSAISVIQKLGIPTHSYIAAAQAAGAMRSKCDHEKYDELISKIVGSPVASSKSFPLAQTTFGYLVQEVVRADLQKQPIDPTALFTLAQQRADDLVRRQPWHWPEDAAGKVTRLDEVRRFLDMFEGADRETILSRLSQDFEVAKPTAANWLRQIEAESAAEPETEKTVKPAEKKPRVNKGEEAAKIVAEHYDGSNKADVVELIKIQLETTKGGAQTFFYAALRKFQMSTVTPTEQPKLTTQDKLKTILEATPDIDRKGFIEKAGEMGIKATTAQTYYYSLTASMGVERQAAPSRGRKKQGGVSRIEQVTSYVEEHRQLPKNILLQKLSEEFTVSKVSAQSYYYAALKAINNKEQPSD